MQSFVKMNIKPGKILLSTPSLQDPHFDKTVIYLAEYNQNGALGFVINKIFPRVFNELTAYKNSKPFTLYEGGPVENESLYFLHRRPSVIEGGTLITGDTYLGGNFDQLVQGINHNTISAMDIKLLIGYCGWDNGELETEITEGSWVLTDINSATVFATPPAMLWEELFNANR